MTTITLTERARALLTIGDSIVDVVREGGQLGVPGGTIYAALMAHGAALWQYEGLMSALVKTGKLKKRGDLYFA